MRAKYLWLRLPVDLDVDELAEAFRISTAPPSGPGPADSEGDDLAGPGSAPDGPPEAAPPAEDKGCQVT